jgi:glycosyltransferase involved in cell wall biosynthesis
MHLAFALLTLVPGKAGGSESSVRELLREFGRGNGPERVTVLANPLVAEAYEDFARGPVALREVSPVRAGHHPLRRLAAIGSARLLARGLRRLGADVLHHPVTVPVPRLAGTPTVTTIHDLQHHDLPSLFSRAERAWRRWAYDDAARKADLVVTPSEYSRGRIVDLLGVEPARVRAIPHGIDHGRFVPEPGPRDADLRTRLRLPERFVLYPANLWPHKNHERLVQALAQVRDRNLHLVLTGADYGRLGELEAVARRAGVGERVHHLGYVDERDLPALLRAAAALVFPSLYEGFGSPPLEAMACGCPVASSTRASLAEIVGEAALTFDPGSAESIAEAIDRITSDAALRRRLRAAGLEHARRYSWSAAAAAYREAYEAAAAMA